MKLFFNQNLLRIKPEYVDKFIDESIIYLGAQSAIDYEIIYDSNRHLVHINTTGEETLEMDEKERLRLEFCWDKTPRMFGNTLEL